MRYLEARRREDLREAGYRIFVTDALRLIAENTARTGGGSYINRRWADAAFAPPKPEDTRDASEIIADIAERAGLKIV